MTTRVSKWGKEPAWRWRNMYRLRTLQATLGPQRQRKVRGCSSWASAVDHWETPSVPRSRSGNPIGKIYMLNEAFSVRVDTCRYTHQPSFTLSRSTSTQEARGIANFLRVLSSGVSSVGDGVGSGIGADAGSWSLNWCLLGISLLAGPIEVMIKHASELSYK